MNQVRIDDYYRDINAGRFPIMRGFHYTEADLRLHLLFQELQGLSVDRKAKIALFGRDVVDDYLAVWQALEELSWVSINDDDIQILGDGVFYIPLIQNLLAHDRNEAIRKKRSSAETSAISLAKPTTNQIEPTNSLI
jgi:coproporphyrinogen III oxidase-like Fe-S oxidoreductase